MTVQALALALLCAVRPAALAAVYALLSSSRPTRPLAAYTIAGAISSVVAGAIVVAGLHGVRLETGTSTVNAVVELALGAASLVVAAGVASGRLRSASLGSHGDGDSRLSGRLRGPSMRVAAGAGVATHLPGLLYLLGLNSIADSDPPLLDGLLAVLIFDAIWLAIPFSALVVSIRRPDAAREAVGRISAWMLEHERAMLTVVFGLVGAYFTAKGVLDLAG